MHISNMSLPLALNEFLDERNAWVQPHSIHVPVHVLSSPRFAILDEDLGLRSLGQANQIRTPSLYRRLAEAGPRPLETEHPTQAS